MFSRNNLTKKTFTFPACVNFLHYLTWRVVDDTKPKLNYLLFHVPTLFDSLSRLLLKMLLSSLS